MRCVPQQALLESITPDALALIERAGRTCWKSENKIDLGTAEKFVEMIISRGHWSVLEHASAMFRFITDRGVTHELCRHRIAAFSMESTRFVNYGGKEIEFIPPETETGECALSPEARALWEAAMLLAEISYKKLLAMGVLPQMARSVLPNSLKTEIVTTMNFRQWRHVFSLRLAQAAHPSMRRLMSLAEAQLHQFCPVVFTPPYGE